MNTTKAAALHDLQPHAAKLRSQQEQIEYSRKEWLAKLAELISIGSEVGREIILARSKFNAAKIGCTFNQWMHIHVPQVSEEQAGKYVRLASEQLGSERECAFCFLPPSPKRPKVERTNPSESETIWGFAQKLASSIRRAKTEAAKNIARKQLAELNKTLGL